ncbi:hypothetical protein F2P81_001730 [Scophthalmus maximus]|uniref:Uncharacterized protein n=1 Tax=Scophthalmus maximus TaxID=52904 RepID=A0A6A4TR11_SCOMX|nr:hypothetical protein F2P81_001730 [Scophthalmus maximus]
MSNPRKRCESAEIVYMVVSIVCTSFCYNSNDWMPPTPTEVSHIYLTADPVYPLTYGNVAALNISEAGPVYKHSACQPLTNVCINTATIHKLCLTVEVFAGKVCVLIHKSNAVSEHKDRSSFQDITPPGPSYFDYTGGSRMSNVVGEKGVTVGSPPREWCPLMLSVDSTGSDGSVDVSITQLAMLRYTVESVRRSDNITLHYKDRLWRDRCSPVFIKTLLLDVIHT